MKVVIECWHKFYLFYLCDKFGRWVRTHFRNRIERLGLRNKDFTILSQNCIGSIWYHDLGQKFLSPTINMLFDPNGFVEFIDNIEQHLSMDIVFVKGEHSRPCGMIGDVMIDFVHYHSEKEVVEKWNERKSRINWDNIFVIACDKGMTDENIERFLNMEKYPNRILFTSKRMDNPHAVYQDSFPDGSDARLLNFSSILGQRFYQKHIDFVAFLNENKK